MPRKCETQGANEAHDSGHIRRYVAWSLCGRLFCAKGNSAREGGRRGTRQDRSTIILRL